MTPTRTELSRGRIVDEAIALLDEEGVNGLSMRRLAQRLGVSTMSTYHHVADKADLVEAIAERVTAGLEAPPPDASWEEAARTLSWSFRSLTQRHPAAFQLLISGPRPDALVRTTTEVINVFESSGFGRDEAEEVVAVLLRYLLGDFAVGRDLSGEGPPAVMATDSAAQRESRFRFGLEVVIAGVAATRPPGDDAPGRHR